MQAKGHRISHEGVAGVLRGSWRIMHKSRMSIILPTFVERGPCEKKGKSSYRVPPRWPQRERAGRRSPRSPSRGTWLEAVARELKQILARHRGWLADPDAIETSELPKQNLGRRRAIEASDLLQPIEEEGKANDPYLAEIEPPYPDWRNEARGSPRRADLRNADLRDANLQMANLSGALLYGANLSGANLFSAHLRCANLFTAILRGANLTTADLRDAFLVSVDITKAKLAASDLTNAWYAPESEPPYSYVDGIKGLSTVQFPPGREGGLVQIRKLLQDASLRELEREATFRIERARTSEWTGVISLIGAIFRWVAFDLTTAYGMRPFRALFLIAAFWFLFSFAYGYAIIQPPGQSQQAGGIHRVLPEGRIGGPAANPEIENQANILKDALASRVYSANWRDAVSNAAYFSLLSAANIGFQEFTPGDWIQRLQSHAYQLRAEGWVRKVAGAQALLSVFLLAMWALTQFGRPFQ